MDWKLKKRDTVACEFTGEKCLIGRVLKACEFTYPASKLSYLGERSKHHENARARGFFPLPLAASPLARAFTRDSLRSPKSPESWPNRDVFFCFGFTHLCTFVNVALSYERDWRALANELRKATKNFWNYWKNPGKALHTCVRGVVQTGTKLKTREWLENYSVTNNRRPFSCDKRGIKTHQWNLESP